MAEQRPYPAREHYDFPVTTSDILREEVAIYKSGPELRVSVLGLHGVYQNSEFRNSMIRYAQLSRLIKVGKREGDTPAVMDDGFYAGAVMGLHSMYRVLPVLQRKQVCMYNPWYRFYQAAQEAENPDTALTIANIEDLRDFQETRYEMLRRAQPATIRTAVAELSTTIFADMPEASDMQESYRLGYFYAASIIADAVSANRA